MNSINLVRLSTIAKILFLITIFILFVMIQRQLLDEPKQLQKTQQLNQQLSQEVKVLTQKVNTLSQKCIELEQQNIETLKRWREIEQSYKAMHEVFIDQVSGGGKFGNDINIANKM